MAGKTDTRIDWKWSGAVSGSGVLFCSKQAEMNAEMFGNVRQCSAMFRFNVRQCSAMFGNVRN